MKKSLLTSLVLALSTLVPAVVAITPVHADSQLSQVLISEIQTSSTSSAADEFVELYNPGDEAADLDGWRVDFFRDDGEYMRTLAEFGNLELPSDRFLVISREDYLPDADYFIATHHGLNISGGTVRLIDRNDMMVDEVGYGSPTYYAGQPAPAPDAGESITRCFGEDGITASSNNAADFISNPNPLPGSGLDCPDPEPLNECTGLIITEIGANLSDDEQFIEIHNPTDELIELWGCTLQTNRGANTHVFGDDDVLEPDEYRAVFIIDTDLILTKTTTGTAYILSSDHAIEVDKQRYENLSADTSWAWFGKDDWRQTYSPTPGDANIWQEFLPCPDGQERNPDTGRCRNVAAASTNQADCGPGRERNPETNRCRNISADAGLQPCGPGRERNPETNRCRNIDTSSGLQPCGPGRERNPDTNRCRNIVTTTSGLQPCGPGRERNPETNRCRNIVSSNTATMPDVHDIHATTDGSPYRWWVAAAAIATVAAYAAFEWRRDIAAIFGKITRRVNR